MSSEIYTFNNYTFNLELESNQINIKLIDNTILEMYEGVVKQKEIYIKLDKFYSMIVKSINNEPNYKMTIRNTYSLFMCIITFNSEVIDFEKKIILDKISSYKIKELLLIEKIKQLKERNNILDQENKELSDQLDKMTQEIREINIKNKYFLDHAAEIEQSTKVLKNTIFPKKSLQLNDNEKYWSYFS
jgi:hypothetical protein